MGRVPRVTVSKSGIGAEEDGAEETIPRRLTHMQLETVGGVVKQDTS